MTSTRKGFYEKILDFKELKLLHEELAGNGIRPSSRIYKAKCVLSNGLVSLKSYSLDSKTQKNNIESSIVRELRLTSQPDCPFIARSFDDFVDAGRWWIVQELCSAGTLAQILQNYDQDIEEGWVVSQIVFLMLQTLDYLHEKSLVHCSLSPENIMFNSGKVVKLFGFQSVRDEGSLLKETELDRVTYLPPELLLDSNPSSIISHQMDVWALGVVAYEIIYGITPFLHLDDKIHVQNIQSKEVEFPWEVSIEFEDFIRQALSKDPVSRPTAAELLMHPWIQQNIDWTPPEGFEDPISYQVDTSSIENEQYNEAAISANGMMNKVKESKVWKSLRNWSPFKWKQLSKVSSLRSQKDRPLMEMRVMTNQLAMKIHLESIESVSSESMTSQGSGLHLPLKDSANTISAHHDQALTSLKGAEEGEVSETESLSKEEEMSLSELRIDNPTPLPHEVRPQIPQSPSLDDIEHFLMSE